MPNELLINQRQATFALRSMIGSAYTNFANESFFVEMARRRAMRGR